MQLLFKAVLLTALAVAIAVAVFVFMNPLPAAPGSPNVRFTDFTPDKVDIRVGESANVVFNVQNREARPINDSKVQIIIEPASYHPYISISDPVVELPPMLAKDARTGEQQVRIYSASLPAKEAVYDVKGVLLVEGKQADLREFELRIRE